MSLKSDCLHYLGYKGQKIGAQLSLIIDECLLECQELASPRHIYDKFCLHNHNNCVYLNKTVQLSGSSINNHLKNCDECYVMAVTLGERLNKKIAYYQYHNLTKATVLDACASAYIELICDDITEEIAQQQCQKNKFITSRFSPGYGDLPLTIQQSLIDLLQADIKIGLFVNGYNLLFPRKSVTAVIGVSNTTSNDENLKCKNCSLVNCQYRKEC